MEVSGDNVRRTPGAWAYLKLRTLWVSVLFGVRETAMNMHDELAEHVIYPLCLVG